MLAAMRRASSRVGKLAGQKQRAPCLSLEIRPVCPGSRLDGQNGQRRAERQDAKRAHASRLAMQIAVERSASRVIQGIVTGVGFLGAGVIVRRERSSRARPHHSGLRLGDSVHGCRVRDRAVGRSLGFISLISSAERRRARGKARRSFAGASSPRRVIRYSIKLRPWYGNLRTLAHALFRYRERFCSDAPRRSTYKRT
jgi:hypothetical protein